MISIKPLFGFLAYNDISLSEFAEKCGMGYTTVLKIKKTGKFTRRQIDKICTCLNLNIKDIMRYED